MDECWSGSFANLAGNLNVFDQDSEESRASVPLSVMVPDRKGGIEMVKQRFLTHFKQWLFAVIRVVGLIVGTNSSIRLVRTFNTLLSTAWTFCFER